MREKNLTRFLSNDFSEHPIVNCHKIFLTPSLKHSKMRNMKLLFWMCLVVNISLRDSSVHRVKDGLKHPVRHPEDGHKGDRYISV